MKSIIWLFTFIFMTSCASNQKTFYYALRPAEGTKIENLPENHSISIGIGPVTFPEWLDQAAVVSYEKDNVLTVPYYHVWAGDLEPMILNVLAANISNITGRQKVFPFPWDNRHRPHYQIRIHIEEFAGTLGGQARLQVKWTLLGNEGKTEKLSQADIMTVALKDQQYETYVAGLNILLANLSKKLAMELNTFAHDDHRR